MIAQERNLTLYEKLKNRLTHPYSSYHLVQITSVMLGLSVILHWPHLNTPWFWFSLLAYMVSFAFSVVVYIYYHPSKSPVRTGWLIGTCFITCVLAFWLRPDWLSALMVMAPLVSCMIASGILYNAILAGVRTHLQRRKNRNR